MSEDARLGLAAEYFALKQTQRNINKMYKVKQADRYSIVCQLREALRGCFPKYVIRTDISKFYESIPRREVIKKINDDNMLSNNSKKVIKQILYEYGRLSGQGKKGIPRGIGISAYLSELYMRKLDKKISKDPIVLYYARYVDDIIIVCTTQRNTVFLEDFAESSAEDAIKKSLQKAINEMDLQQNPNKTLFRKVDGKVTHCIDYLGYRFRFGKADVDVNLTKSKVEKYRNKIDFMFQDYEEQSRYDEKKARILLVNRVKFITGNTRLIGNKKNVFVGIYFSNKILTNLSYLRAMDCYLKYKISSLGNQRAKKRLEKLSFVTGFKDKTFHKFSRTDIGSITKVWKYA